MILKEHGWSFEGQIDFEGHPEKKYPWWSITLIPDLEGHAVYFTRRGRGEFGAD